jgi:ribulose 1,5-bisphosphate synthetase/thiazole synthase
VTFDAQEAGRQVSGEIQDVRHTTCVIAGCGPAGAMLGLLLARRGVDVLVLLVLGRQLRE